MLSENAALLPCLTAAAAAWATSIHLDIVDLGDEPTVFFAAIAPAGSAAPADISGFWKIPGRVTTGVTPESPVGHLRPDLGSILSAKVKGQVPEENPRMALVVGVMVRSPSEQARPFVLGAQIDMRTDSALGFAPGGGSSQTAS